MLYLYIYHFVNYLQFCMDNLYSTVCNVKMLMPLLIKRYTKAPAKCGQNKDAAQGKKTSPKKPQQSLHSV